MFQHLHYSMSQQKRSITQRARLPFNATSFDLNELLQLLWHLGWHWWITEFTVCGLVDPFQQIMAGMCINISAMFVQTKHIEPNKSDSMSTKHAFSGELYYRNIPRHCTARCLQEPLGARCPVLPHPSHTPSC